jgi:hypothetical protein
VATLNYALHYPPPPPLLPMAFTRRFQFSECPAAAADVVPPLLYETHFNSLSPPPTRSLLNYVPSHSKKSGNSRQLDSQSDIRQCFSFLLLRPSHYRKQREAEQTRREDDDETYFSLLFFRKTKLTHQTGG